MNQKTIINHILSGMTQKTFNESNPSAETRTIWINTNDQYQDFFHHAQGDDTFFPDDHRYEMTHDILLALSDHLSYNPDDDLNDIDQFDLLDPLVPVYNHDLLTWLSSSNSRYTYVDEAIQELGKGDNLMLDLMSGYFKELEETYYLIIQWINDNSEEDNEEDD